MENKAEDICRMCLKVEDTDFLPLDEYRITKLKVIIPQLNIDASASGRFLICVKCKDALDNSYNVRRTILDNQELIQTRKAKLNINSKVHLDRIFNENESDWSQNSICRICLNMSKEKNVFIDSLPPDDPFQDVLHTCLLILDRDLTLNPLVCTMCVDKLLDMFSFISSSLTVENKIRQYCESNAETKDVRDIQSKDLLQVLEMLKDTKGKEEEAATNDFLSEFEVQDEEGNDIFDSIPCDAPSDANNQWTSEYDTTRKRASGAPSEARPPKQSKRGEPGNTLETPVDDLPHFKFNVNLMYNVPSDITLQDWLNIVDMQKKKLNWSDNMTIQKVLLRLQSLPELYAWFNSMADILEWDEWKKKLLTAFPSPDDYSIDLRKAVNRKRRATETFVKYLKDKTALLEKINITGPKAVSCIISSLTWSDLLVSSIARMGNYQSPEDLMEYFKKCDEKEEITVKRVPQTPEKQNTTTPDGETPQTPNGQPALSKKKMKRKCIKCHQLGHVAMECKTVTGTMIFPKLPQRSQAPSNKQQNAGKRQNQSGPSKARLRIKANRSKGHPLRRNITSQTGQRRSQVNQTGPRRPQGNQTGPRRPEEMSKAERKRLATTLCNYCGKYGHKTSTCPHPHIEELKRMQSGSQPQIYNPPKCAHCGATNHVSFNCPRPKSVDGSTSSAQNNAKNNLKCGYCHRNGHTSDSCFIANRKAEKNAKKDNPSSVNENRQERVSCSHCGSTRHASRHCGRASHPNPSLKTPEKRDSPAYRPAAPRYYPPSVQNDEPRQNDREPVGYPQMYDTQGYRTMLCLKCYKLGHKTESCPRFAIFGR